MKFLIPVLMLLASCGDDDVHCYEFKPTGVVYDQAGNVISTTADTKPTITCVKD